MSAPTEQGYPAFHQHESTMASVMRYSTAIIALLKRPYAHLVVVGMILLFTAMVGFAKLGYGPTGHGLSGYATLGDNNASKIGMSSLANASGYTVNSITT